MNILILSCGSKIKLLSYFMDRANGFDKVVVTDCSDYAPAMYVADKAYKVSRMSEPNYISEILDICKKEEINVVLPLQEDELVLMSDNKDKFGRQDIQLIVSNCDKIRMCKDKYACSLFLTENGINAVDTFLSKDTNICISNNKKIIIKPRYGAGSVNTIVGCNDKFMENVIKNSEEELIIQPYIEGKEYGVDVYVDFLSKEIIDIFIKEKIKMRAGETEKSVSVINNDIVDLVTKTVRTMELLGPIDIDVMECDGIYYILEINPRFGGGYPHAYECGVNFPKNIAQNIAGISNKRHKLNYKENIRAMKYTDILILNDS